MCCLRRKKNKQAQYQELISTVPSVPAHSAPVIPVSQGFCARQVPVANISGCIERLRVTPEKTYRHCEIPFSLPPRCIPQNTAVLRDVESQEKEKEGAMKVDAQRDILAHRGSLSVRSWYPVGSVLTGLYSMTPLNEVAAPPLGMATRLCFSVEYRHSSEQLVVSLLRLSNLLPRFHSNMTLVELRLLPNDRRPRQAKARGTGPDPEFNDCLIFQATVCVLRSTLSVCVLSVEKDGKRHAVGRVLFPLEGELGQAGRVLWRNLDPEEETQVNTNTSTHTSTKR
ncbi:hypothetical protein CCH79_00003247, partial [Gambusia affinis]